LEKGVLWWIIDKFSLVITNYQSTGLFSGIGIKLVFHSGEVVIIILGFYFVFCVTFNLESTVKTHICSQTLPVPTAAVPRNS